MKTVKGDLSGVEVLIEVADDVVIGDYSTSNPLDNTRKTSGGLGGSIKKAIETVAVNVMDSAAGIIFSFADVCKKQSENFDNAPDEIDIEYSLSFDIKSNLWILTNGSNSAIKVRMKWKKD